MIQTNSKRWMLAGGLAGIKRNPEKSTRPAKISTDAGVIPTLGASIGHRLTPIQKPRTLRSRPRRVTEVKGQDMKAQTTTCLILGCAVLIGRPAVADLMAGGLYATAENLNQVIQINSDGSWSTALNVTSEPMGLAFRSSNEVYVTGGIGPSYPAGELVAYRSDGSVVFTVSSVPVTNIWPNGSWGTGMAIDSQGTAYVATWNSPGATMVSPNGTASDWTGYQYGLWWGRAAAFSPSGQLYMIQGLDYGPNPTSTVATIDTVTGAVNYVLQNVPLLDGLAIDSQGNLYLSEYTQNEIVKVAAGTNTITPFASLAGAGSLAIGPDGRLYAFSEGSSNQIWSYGLGTGQGSLYATDLPYLTDIAFDTGAELQCRSRPPCQSSWLRAP